MTVWDRVERWALRLAGALVLAIGIGHAFLPTLGYPTSATDGMSPTAKDHFYFLGTSALHEVRREQQPSLRQRLEPMVTTGAH